MTTKTAFLALMGILFSLAGCSDHSKQTTPSTGAAGKQAAAPATGAAPTLSPTPVPTAVSTVAPTPKPESVPKVDLTERNKDWHFTAWIGQICSGVGPRVWGEPLRWHSFFGHSFRFRKSVLASPSRRRGLGKGTAFEST